MPKPRRADPDGNSISVYDVLKYDTVVITKSAVKAIEEVYA